jgi:arylformamidase
MSVFLEYDCAALDAQYFVRGYLPEWDDKIQEFKALSATRHAVGRMHLDLPYGDHPRQKMDVFLPENVRPDAPVLVFFHGGYWRMMDKSQFGFVAVTAEVAGAITVVPNYRLLPDVSLEQIIEDACDAVRWVLGNIAQYSGDPGKIVLCGHSAGAQLAAQVTTHVGRQFRAMIGISGIYDLRPIAASFLNEIGFLDAGTLQKFPAPEAVSALPCCGELVFGGAEPEELSRQSSEQATYWKRPGSTSTLTCIHDANHATVVEQLKDPSSQLGQIVTKKLTL